MRGTAKIGIRQMVEFCCRCGDLSCDHSPSASAQEGLRTHQKIQQRYADEAVAEYRLKLNLEIDTDSVDLGGRIDLLFENEQPPRVEEIKTIYSFMKSFSEGYDEPHWAQVKCYAAAYAIEQEIDEVAVSLNYVNLFNHQEYRQTKTLPRKTLVGFLRQVLRQYLDWHRLIETQRTATLDSAVALQFPHQSFRQQQHHFASQVYRNIQRQGQLMVEAPTGSGKTISTLFPAIKAIGENLADQIIYLSAKTSGQNLAVAAVEQMVAQGLEISYLVIQAKAKACACNHDEREINADGKCIRTLGFYDRLASARQELVSRRSLHTTTVQRIATEYKLCPFELSLQMLPWVDIVIADFNYVFDPLVQLSYFRTDTRRKLLLVDELHNLLDRARSMYSASISRKQIKQVLASEKNSDITAGLGRLLRALDKQLLEQEADEAVSDEATQAFAKAISHFGEKLNLNIFNNKHINAETFEFTKAVFRYQCIHNLYAEHHKTINIKPVKKRQIKLLCLNAFEYLNSTYPLFQSVCGFSATLTPGPFFQQALGFEQATPFLRLDSCFPQEKLRVNICNYIDTRYQQRESYIDQICATIQRCYRVRPGNYLVFFASYFFMQQVFEHFNKHYGTIQCTMQQKDSNDDQRREYLQQFFERDKTLGFAIMGGIFAEGIDYQGKALIGAIVVGVGLPQPNTEQQLIENDFRRMRLNGFDYAYRFPGLTRVQQSAGRVIRSETDKGVIVLLDRRFEQTAYREHFPPHWQAQLCADIETLENSLTEFWR
ncbi:MAG: ATP-dependent DNA helicase [Gammaproteobacteria bacterium]|nr:ATP-dependent DNA helicase [Gammaproteobacteria bacterium]